MVQLPLKLTSEHITIALSFVVNKDEKLLPSHCYWYEQLACYCLALLDGVSIVNCTIIIILIGVLRRLQGVT